MEVSVGGGVGDDGVVVVDLGIAVAGPVRAQILRAEAAPEGGDLLLQVVGLRALLLEGGSGGVDAFLSGVGRIEEGGLLLELLAARGVGGFQGGGFLFERPSGGESFVPELRPDGDDGGTGGGGHERGSRGGGGDSSRGRGARGHGRREGPGPI